MKIASCSRVIRVVILKFIDHFLGTLDPCFTQFCGSSRNGVENIFIVEGYRRNYSACLLRVLLAINIEKEFLSNLTRPVQRKPKCWRVKNLKSVFSNLYLIIFNFEIHLKIIEIFFLLVFDFLKKKAHSGVTGLSQTIIGIHESIS